MRKVAKFMYLINAIVLLITIFVGYGEVKENLDGWHDFTKEYAMIFVILCLVMIAICVYNVWSLEKSSLCIYNYIGGIALVILPVIFRVVAANLQGKVETDFQYLMLRTFQGFDNMFIWLIIVSFISWIILSLKVKVSSK